MVNRVWGSLFIVFLTISTVAKARPATREWTILLYVAGDEESLYEPTRRLMKRIERAPSLRRNGPVAVVAQWDDVDADPNYRYHFEYVPRPTRQLGPDTPPLSEARISAQLGKVFHYSERDSGHPATLKDFVKWGIKAYPAKHYGLILSGHSWGQQGLMQDFHTPGNGRRKPSTIMTNYEIRRALQEATREERTGPLDFLLVDACIAGQLEIALEFQQVARYFGASSLETPNHSFPLDLALEPFLQVLKERPSTDDLLERWFFRPWVESYLKGHVRGGALVPFEGQMDPVDAFVLRTERLGRLNQALQEVTPRLQWNPNWQLFADDDDNVDLWQLAQDPQLQSLQPALAYVRTDPSLRPTLVDFSQRPKTEGAWAYVQIDEQARYRDMAVCQAVKAFALLNGDQPDLLPSIQSVSGEWVSAARADCNYWGEHHQVDHPEADLPNPDGGPHPLITIFQHRLGWKSGKSAYLVEQAGGKRVAGRTLVIWIPRHGRDRRQVRLRLVGTQKIDLVFSSKDREEGKVPAYTLNPDFPRDALYVVEGHTNGVPFKHGLGILLKRSLSLQDSPFWQGLPPVEIAEPSPFAWKLEDYLLSTDARPLIEVDFYRAHRIRETGWDTFLFGNHGTL